MSHSLKDAVGSLVEFEMNKIAVYEKLVPLLYSKEEFLEFSTNIKSDLKIKVSELMANFVIAPTNNTAASQVVITANPQGKNDYVPWYIYFVC
jgi:hypothetical protein